MNFKFINIIKHKILKFKIKKKYNNIEKINFKLSICEENNNSYFINCKLNKYSYYILTTSIVQLNYSININESKDLCKYYEKELKNILSKIEFI